MEIDMKLIIAGWRIFIFMIIAEGLFPLDSVAQSSPAVPENIRQYAVDIQTIINSSNVASLEKVFEKGLLAAKILTDGGNLPSILERADETTLQEIQRLMVGFWVNREEVIVVEPKPDFFVKLAHEKGSATDKTFFDTLNKTYPQGWFPSYIKQLTDFGGCSVFDGKTLSKIYGEWIDFKRNYPERYEAKTATELKQIESVLTTNCVCGDEDGYQRELKFFMETYPDSSVASSANDLLKAVNDHTSTVRFHCTSN
jgi:hypothetical protein